MAESISVSREMHAPAEVVWNLVSDLPRMGEWSKENQGGKWIGEASGPAVGAKFRGSNRNGIRRWSTLVTVREAQPGERFGFDVSYLGIPISSWTYEFESTGAGSTVTEQWVDRRPGWFTPLARVATGVGDRTAHTRAGMAHTLEQLARAAETAGGADS